MIFSNAIRTDETTKSKRETNFDFLNRSARPEIARVRNLISSCLKHYPRGGIDELISRIKSSSEQTFRSASFELLLHEALRRLHFSLIPHPQLENGAPTHPDFLVMDQEGQSFYLEAVLVTEKDGKSPAAEAIKATTLEPLYRSPHPYFRVTINSDGDPSTQPKSRELIRQIVTWLDSLDLDTVSETLDQKGFDALPEYIWSHEQWTLSFRPIPLPKERRGNAKTMLGLFGQEGGLVDGWSPLRDAIKKKGSKYGEIEKPLIVALNSDTFFLDQTDEMQAQALFGQEYVAEYLDGQRFSMRFPNGAWNGPHGPQSCRVSGAWFFNDLTPYSVSDRRNTLYLNPWANHDVPLSMLRFPHVKAVEDRMKRFEGLSLREIFELPEGWPG